MQKKYQRLILSILISASFVACQTPGASLSGVNPGTGPFQAAVEFYRGPLNHLNAVRQGQCPMFPSCSKYCLQSLKKHGPIIGGIMTCDRLMRCGRDELRLSNRIYVHGTWRYFDTVDNNDFWWDQPETH